MQFRFIKNVLKYFEARNLGLIYILFYCNEKLRVLTGPRFIENSSHTNIQRTIKDIVSVFWKLGANLSTLIANQF